MALEQLQTRFGVLRQGRWVVSADVHGGPRRYVNTVALFWTEEGEAAVREGLKALETHMGRVRGGEEVCIDLDLLAYGDWFSNELWQREYNRKALMGLVLGE